MVTTYQLGTLIKACKLRKMDDSKNFIFKYGCDKLGKWGG